MRLHCSTAYTIIIMSTQVGSMKPIYLFPGQKVIHVSQDVGKGGPDGRAQVHLVRVQDSHGVSIRVMEVEVVFVVVGYAACGDSTCSPPAHICSCRKWNNCCETIHTWITAYS